MDVSKNLKVSSREFFFILECVSNFHIHEVITHPINGWLDGCEPSQRWPLILKSTFFLFNFKLLLMFYVF
ncbi:MAG: hypothetical protein AB1390_11450, partial [Nitrospirota bacterium]